MLSRYPAASSTADMLIRLSPQYFCMNVQVHGPGPAAPFLGARDLFETERDIKQPVTVDIVPDPDERTRVSHPDDGHRLTISRQAATSATTPLTHSRPRRPSSWRWPAGPSSGANSHTATRLRTT